MENFHSPPIVQKVYDFYKELRMVIEKMEKKDKYTLGEKMEKTTLDFLELLIEASLSPKDWKIDPLSKSAVKLDFLKILIRLGQESKTIPTQKYLSLEGKLIETGKMLGGWIKSVKTEKTP